MRITYDEGADALYVQIRPKDEGEPKVGTRTIQPGVMMDVDADGNPIGFEVLWASERYPGVQLTMLESPRGFISLARAAEIAGLSPQTLKVQAGTGRLRAEKHGRNWVTTEAWLRAYLESRKGSGKPAAM